MPTLYVVGTPIGNLSDISPRALDALRSCALIAAEDTRVTKKLLNHFGIATPLISCHRHNEQGRALQVIERMTAEGIDVALVTDAGMPAISDPGHLFVREAWAAGVDVKAVPGPSAVCSALSVAGFDAREFAFYGFLPREKGPLREKLRQMARSVPVAVVYESPHRVLALLEAAEVAVPGCEVCACCDLTKLYEATLWGKVAEVLAAMRQNPNVEKGEYCVVFDFTGVELADEIVKPTMTAEAAFFEALLAGKTLRVASADLQEMGYKRNEVYRASVRVRSFLDEWEGDTPE